MIDEHEYQEIVKDIDQNEHIDKSTVVLAELKGHLMISGSKRSREPSSLFQDHYSLMVEEDYYIKENDIINDFKTYEKTMSL